MVRRLPGERQNTKYHATVSGPRRGDKRPRRYAFFDRIKPQPCYETAPFHDLVCHTSKMTPMAELQWTSMPLLAT